MALDDTLGLGMTVVKALQLDISCRIGEDVLGVPKELSQERFLVRRILEIPLPEFGKIAPIYGIQLCFIKIQINIQDDLEYNAVQDSGRNPSNLWYGSTSSCCKGCGEKL